MRDVRTVNGTDLHAYTQEPWLDAGTLAWRDGAAQSGDLKCFVRRAIRSAPTAV